MALLKLQGFEAFLRRPPPDTRLVLFHGADAGAVRELARRTVIATAGSADDPFNVARFEDTALSSDPARLADEYGAISMMGGRRAIWVTDAGDGLMKALGVLESDIDSGLIVAEAGVLPKSSKLRSLLEGHARAVVCQVYDPDTKDLAQLADSMLERAGLAISPDARARLVELIGADKALSRSEIDKLILYCHGQTEVSLADIEAVCGDTSSVTADNLIDAAFGGDLSEADHCLMSLLAAGGDAPRLLNQASGHASGLQALQLDVLNGQPIDAALKRAKPQIFFRRQRAIGSQLRSWDMDALASIQSAIAAATLQTRQYPDLDEAIAGRAFLAIARMARALSRNIN
jgi:DNA polymerase III subunit delta